MAAVPIDSPDSLEQQNEVFRTVLLRYQEVELDSQVRAYSANSHVYLFLQYNVLWLYGTMI